MTSDAAAPERARRPAGSVLIVDDEAPVRGVLRSMLEDLGYEVLTASEGAEALETCRRHAAVLSGVLLDLTMPGTSPERMLGAIREIAPGVPVILASGLSESEVRARYEDLPCAGYLRKPFGPQVLSETLSRAIEELSSDAPEA